MLDDSAHYSATWNGTGKERELIGDTIPMACQRLLTLAERDPRRVASIAQRVLEQLPTDDLSAWTNYTVGWVFLCWQRPDAARSYLRDAQAAFQSQGLQFGVLHCQHAMLL